MKGFCSILEISIKLRRIYLALIEHVVRNDDLLKNFEILASSDSCAVEAIRHDLVSLARLKIDYTQLSVITPLPRTAFWSETVARYGIFEKNWRKYDVKHLVFNHPHIKFEEMERIMIWGSRLLNPPARYWNNISRLSRRYLTVRPRHLFTSFVQALPFNYRDRRSRWFFSE